MNERRIKAIIYGVGEMGRIATRLLLDKGVEIVGAIGHRSNVGRDLGEVAAAGRLLGIEIDSDAAKVVTGTEADIVVMSFCSDMETMYPAARLCIENGKNVISIAEEAFYPWGRFPELTAQLDSLAKKHRVTVTGAGIQDLIWFGLITTLSSVCHRIDAVVGESSANIDDFGPAVASSMGMGLSAEAFAAAFGSESVRPTPFGVALEALVADLGMTVRKAERRVDPILAAHDTESAALGRVIKAGSVLGTSQVDEIHTVEGPIFKGTFAVRPYGPGEKDYCHWSIKGSPDVAIECPTVPGALGTCTMLINRVPDVINAAPGFVSVDRLPRVRYRSKTLDAYLSTGG